MMAKSIIYFRKSLNEKNDSRIKGEEQSVSKVSVVIPAYNHAQYIGEAIDSVLSQTFPDFELIVVDDGSPDNTEEVVANFTDPRITYIRQNNRGQASARNVGILASKGKYIGFLDDDDIWLPQKLELQVKALDDNPESALVCSDVIVFDDETGADLGRVWHERRFHGWIDPAKASQKALKYLLHSGCFMAPTAVLIRRGVLLSVWGFNESLTKNHEDWDLFVRICRNFPVEIHDIPLARNRQHAYNVHSRWEYMCESAVEVLNMAIDGKYLLKPDELRLVRRRLTRTLSRYGRNLVVAGRTREGRKKLIDSMRTNPWRPSPYAWFALSLLGARTIQKLRHWRRSTVQRLLWLKTKLKGELSRAHV